VLEQHPELTHQISTLRRKALARALRQSGYTQQQADLHAQAAFNVFLDTRHQVELFPYTVEVLHQLHQRYQLGALTNGNADIGRTAIGHYFDFSFSAEQLNNSKPHPALFHAALKYTGLSGSVCVHVGDHPTHDIQGAQQAGFFSVWVNRNSAAWPGGTPPSAEVSCLSELPEVIKQLA